MLSLVGDSARWIGNLKVCLCLTVELPFRADCFGVLDFLLDFRRTTRRHGPPPPPPPAEREPSPRRSRARPRRGGLDIVPEHSTYAIDQ